MQTHVVIKTSQISQKVRQNQNAQHFTVNSSASTLDTCHGSASISQYVLVQVQQYKSSTETRKTHVTSVAFTMGRLWNVTQLNDPCRVI